MPIDPSPSSDRTWKIQSGAENFQAQISEGVLSITDSTGRKQEFDISLEGFGAAFDNKSLNELSRNPSRAQEVSQLINSTIAPLIDELTQEAASEQKFKDFFNSRSITMTSSQVTYGNNTALPQTFKRGAEFQKHYTERVAKVQTRCLPPQSPVDFPSRSHITGDLGAAGYGRPAGPFDETASEEERMKAHGRARNPPSSGLSDAVHKEDDEDDFDAHVAPPLTTAKKTASEDSSFATNPKYQILTNNLERGSQTLYNALIESSDLNTLHNNRRELAKLREEIAAGTLPNKTQLLKALNDVLATGQSGEE